MNRFKINAFFKEFPFLTTLVEDANGVEEVKVARIDRDFLGKVPQYRGATGSLVGIGDSERIFLLNEKGEVLAEPRQALDITHNEAYEDDEKEEGETVGETLTSLEDPNTIAYAVCIYVGYRIRNHHSVGGYSVVVYKPPKGFTLKEWVEDQESRAKAMLDAQLAEIDAEA
jgi:hypothetical protein